MADSLQKIDRLIEGQGQLTEIATRADHKADITAKGVADLTLQTQQGFAELRQEITQVDEKVGRVDGKVAGLDGKVVNLDGKVNRVDEKVDRVDEKVDRVDEKVDSLRAEMNQRFDQLFTLISGRLGL